MSNMFFKLDSGRIVNLDHAKWIDPNFIGLSYRDQSYMPITCQDYERLEKFLKQTSNNGNYYE